MIQRAVLATAAEATFMGFGLLRATQTNNVTPIVSPYLTNPSVWVGAFQLE